MTSKIYNYLFSEVKDIYYNIYETYLLKKLRSNNLNYTKQDLVSVIIPTYNRSKILTTRSLPSVLEQTHKNFELIIIGDCCTDDTEQQILSLNDPRIKFENLNYKKKKHFRNPKNIWLAGEVVAANYALKICSGNWIARLDDDEIWTNDHIEKLLHFCIDNEYEFASGYVETPGFIRKEPPKIISDYFQTTNIKNKNINNPYIGGHSSFFFKSYLKEFKYNKDCWRKNINRSNDLDLVVRFLKAGVKMGYLDEKVGINLPRPGETELGWKAAKKK